MHRLGLCRVDQIKLVPTVKVKLRVNVEKEQCPNVTAFDLTMDPERPNRFTGTAINDTDALPYSVSPPDPAANHNQGWTAIRRLQGSHAIYASRRQVIRTNCSTRPRQR